MKHWTIRLKVTLWFTLFMTLLSALAVGILPVQQRVCRTGKH